MIDLTVQDFNGEPRMRDLDIAEALGFSRPRVFRELIARNLTRLAAFGEITRRTARRVNKYNPAAAEYWLNEYQCFYLCTQSKADKAFEVTQQIINVFVAWRHGDLLPSPEAATELQVIPAASTLVSLVREVRLTKGIVAARAIYDSLPLPPVANGQLRRIPVVRDEVDAKWGILPFLRQKCIVSGDAEHWVKADDVIIAYSDYCIGVGEQYLGSRTFSKRLLALSRVYNCPETGEKFWQQIRKDNGYCGLRLVGS